MTRVEYTILNTELMRIVIARVDGRRVPLGGRMEGRLPTFASAPLAPKQGKPQCQFQARDMD